MRSGFGRVVPAAAIIACLALFLSSSAPGQNASAFDKLPGRWVGDGRLGMSDGKIENVKCRVTYFIEPADQLKQNIRCASESGSIEVQSLITNAAGKLTGTWSELTHNLNGELTGEVTQTGFRVVVKGGDMTANMDILFRDARQIVEIQFINSTLRGLTLILTKG
jgi:hypothetical protein